MNAPLLRSSSLGKRFGGVIAIDEVSFDIAPNELVCVIGANGAGKSTLLNLLCGVIACDQGTMEFDGTDVTGRPAHAFARAGILRKFQVPSVFPSLTVWENLVVSTDALGTRSTRDELDALLSRIGLTDHRTARAGTLAHGMKQWLELGICLAHRPKLLLLDEPTAGMTHEETVATAKIVIELGAACAVVVVEHDMSFVGSLGCRTCVMHQGKLIRDGSFDEIRDDDFVREIYLGYA